MGWPYQFVDLTHEQKLERRELLDRYGIYAQLSAIIPVLAIQLYRLGVWVYTDRQKASVTYSSIPSSPRKKEAGRTRSAAISRKWRVTLWWLEEELATGWGLRGHWIAGGSWAIWLSFLCVHQAGNDYLHVTKRFGEIAMSQLPFHYMLASKSTYSPLALALRSSHEQLNPWHRILGRIIYGLVLLHGVWYLNFFIQSGILGTRIYAPVVIIGILALIMFTVLITSSLELVRRWNYRVFFIFHVTIGIFVIPLLWFHAEHMRWYIAEALVLFLLDFVARKLDTITGFAKITRVPHTKLVKLKVPIPTSKIGTFKAAPGQHVYLSIPSESATKSNSALIHNLLFNPFTIAEVSDNDITLVIRALHGPTTKALNQLANLSKARPPINIEGPYGTARKFPRLPETYDRILLVAGGVGATFILPIYQQIREQLELEGTGTDRLILAWSMRSAAEASWAMDLENGGSLTEAKSFNVFFTRSRAHDQAYDDDVPADGSVELDELQDVGEVPILAEGKRERPDLRQIVDDVFAGGVDEKVAVLVCGPTEMARELRKHVGKYVMDGREVWWHDEAFGW